MGQQSYMPLKSYLGKVKEVSQLPIDALNHFKRAGVFISIKNNKDKYYLFSVQTGSSSKTPFIRDFGGHIEPGEHPIHAALREFDEESLGVFNTYISCLLYTSPSPRDGLLSRMPSSA